MNIFNRISKRVPNKDSFLFFSRNLQIILWMETPIKNILFNKGETTMKKVFKNILWAMLSVIFTLLASIIDIIAIVLLALNKGVRIVVIKTANLIGMEDELIDTDVFNDIINSGYKVYIDRMYPTDEES